MDPAQLPRRRLRLWHLIAGGLLVLVIVLVASAFALRAAGAAELRRTIAELTARGYPMTVEALRAGAVGGDPQVQELYGRWRASRPGKGDDFGKAAYDPTMSGWIDRGEPVPQKLRDMVSAHTSEFDDLRTAIRTQRLRVGWAADLGSFLKDGADLTDFTPVSPDLFNLREAAHFLRASALVGDPQAFADLLGLVDALSPVRGQLDGASEAALTAIVDQTAVELEVLGRLTGPAADDWLARRPRLRTHHAEALRWDLGLTCFLFGRLGRLPAPATGSATWSSQLEVVGGLPADCREWIFHEADIAALFRVQAALSERLQGQGSPLVRPSSRWLSANGTFAAEALVVLLDLAMTSEAEQRSRHVAVLIRREAIRRGGLPSDNAAVFADQECGALMEGGESAYWLAYEPLGPTRFRIAVDTGRPLPAIRAGLPRGPTWYEQTNPAAFVGSSFGQPASKALRVSLSRANTEIAVPDFPKKPALPFPLSPPTRTNR